jgi:mRNA interferase RelE/StbE
MTHNLEYQVSLTMQAQRLLQEIKDRREQQLLIKRLEKLKYEPDKQGKPLSQELQGYRSLRAVGQRYRIIYRVERANIIVVVVGIGRRKEGDKDDVYAVTRQLLTEILPQPEEDE